MGFFASTRAVAVLLLILFTAPQATWADQNQNGTGNAITTEISTTQREAIASAARRALRFITLARNAIHNKDPVQARAQVRKARELLSLIEAARPTVRVKEHIWVVRQHMDYASSQDVINDLALIDAELLNLAHTLPTNKAHRHLQATQAYLEQNDSAAARRELDRLEASLVVVEFDLPLATSEQQIRLAQAALFRNRLAEADKNLGAAEESIQFVTLSGSARSASARTLLGRAAKNYADKNYAAAKVDLARAGERFRDAGKHADEKSREEAQKLAADIDALNDRIEGVADDHTHKFGNFLHRSAALIEREAQDLWLRYRQQQDANRTLRKLLDAKTHLHYAEHDLDTGRDHHAIRKELESTIIYLNEALNTADSPLRDRIIQLRMDVHALGNVLNGDREQARVRYEQVMADLMNLIHQP